MKRLVIPLGLVLSLSLIALAGWLGYTSVDWNANTLPLAFSAATPTPAAQTRTTRVTRGDVRQVLTVPGQVTVPVQQQLSFSAAGRLLQVAVRAGDPIAKGQTLARLNPEPLQLALAQAQVDRDIKKAALDKLKAGPTASELTAANAAVRDAQVALQNAQYNLTIAQNSSTAAQTIRDREYEVAWYEANYGESLNKYNAGKIDKNRLDLDYSNLLTAKERLQTARTQATISLNSANQSVANAQEALRKAQANLATLKAGADATEIRQAELALQSSEVALAQAQANAGNTTLVAPFHGRVFDVTAKVGDSVSANAGFITVADLAQIEIQTTVGQEDVILVVPGQGATLTFDARAGETFSGKVSRIVPTRTGTSGAVNYSVFVVLDKPPAGLLPGMTADADIILAERKDVLVLPRRSVRAKANSTMQLSVLESGQTVARSIKIGLVGDLNVEILSGLREGDQVVTTQ